MTVTDQPTPPTTDEILQPIDTDKTFSVEGLVAASQGDPVNYGSPTREVGMPNEMASAPPQTAGISAPTLDPVPTAPPPAPTPPGPPAAAPEPQPEAEPEAEPTDISTDLALREDANIAELDDDIALEKWDHETIEFLGDTLHVRKPTDQALAGFSLASSRYVKMTTRNDISGLFIARHLSPASYDRVFSRLMDPDDDDYTTETIGKLMAAVVGLKVDAAS